MKIKESVSLKNLTTLKIGGMAKYYCEIKNEKELEDAINFALEKKLKIFVLGGGSDIIIDDKGFDGMVVRLLNDNLEFSDSPEKTDVTAGAGMVWDELVGKCVEKGLQGIECMSGIPGSVGASPVQNIGAYGQEIKDTFLNLRAYDIKNRKFIEFTKDECEFGYRESIFKKKEYWQKFIITKITLRLRKSQDPDVKYDSLKAYLDEHGIKDPTVQEIRNAVLDIRSGKFEDYHKVPNAGSFFKNPVIGKEKLDKILKSYPDMPSFDAGGGKYKLFAGWLIERAGWKGKRIGNSQVSPHHALILLNPEKKASAKEILDLADKIVKDVNNKFGVKLDKEVQYIN